jgi:cytidylate kinase
MTDSSMPRAVYPTPYSSVPVIAIDGPSASGKGTVAERVAGELGFHYLDSGALYRLTAHAARRQNVSLDDEAGLCALAGGLAMRFEDGEVFLDGRAVGDVIRSESCGNDASRIAALPCLRAALLDRQRAFRKPPGLVTDGRDMGIVVFPDAGVKIFLTASPEERAERRYKQLIEKGMSANLPALVREMRERDMRDAERKAAPLEPAKDALLLDTTGMTVDQVVQAIMRRCRQAIRK